MNRRMKLCLLETFRKNDLCLGIFLFIYALNLYGSSCSYEDDPYLQSEQSACTSNSKEWVCELNRCMTKESAIDTRNRLGQCMAIEDKEQAKKCVDDLANEKSENPDIKYDAPVKEALAQGVYGMSVGLVAVSYLSKESKATCWSKTILTGASLSFLASEIYQYFFLKDQLEDYRKEYRNKELADSTYNAQVDAFNYLRKEQSLVKEIADKKYKLHLLLTATYGAAAATALYEMVYPGATKCEGKTPEATPKPVQPNPPSVPSGTSIIPKRDTGMYLVYLFIMDSIFPNAFADNKFNYGKKEFSDYLPTLLGAGAATLISMKQSLSKYFTSSAGIAVVSSLASFLSYQLAQEHKKVVSQAKDNITKIDEALNEFKGDAQQFCPDGRDDLSNPNCYCYNEDGSANENRSASATCQKMWHNKSITAVPGDYKDTSILGELGCVSKDEQYDADCNCKQMINTKTGDDACLKTTAGGFNLGNLAKATSLKDTQTQMNEILKGNLKAANINEGDLKQRAARTKDAQDALLRQFNKDKKTPFVLPDEEKNKLLLSQFAPEKLLNQAQDGSVGKTPQELFPITPNSGDKKLKDAIEKISPKLDYNKNNPKPSDPSAKKEELDFNLNLSKSQRSSSDLQFDKEKDKFKFSKQDIHDNKDQTLWDIITYRYNQSGLQRLFSDE